MTVTAAKSEGLGRTAPAALPVPDRSVAYWLFACAAMVFAMAIVGAVTRLTESGLSMVEWRPLIGSLPPLSQAEWERVFALYQQSPEYTLKNAGMDLAAFKQIFFWEWLHRLWGRLIGLVYALPMAYFALRGRLTGGLMPLALVALALGAAQGLWGWYMVQSGLVDRPSVSQYRLAGHLSLAFAIYVLLIWTGCKALRLPSFGLRLGDRPAGGVLVSLTLLGLTVFWGALVAGLDAGLAYNTFPLMDGALLPQGVFSILPAWKNPFENTALVQFIHRWLAIAAALSILWWAHRLTKRGLAGPVSRLAAAAMAMVCLQVGLGIATLLSHVALPLGVLHQGGALVLTGLLTAIAYRLLHPQGR